MEDGVEMVEVEYVGLSEDDSFEVIGEAGRKRIRAREKEEESRKGEGGPTAMAAKDEEEAMTKEAKEEEATERVVQEADKWSPDGVVVQSAIDEDLNTTSAQGPDSLAEESASLPASDWSSPPPEDEDAENEKQKRRDRHSMIVHIVHEAFGILKPHLETWGVKSDLDLSDSCCARAVPLSSSFFRVTVSPLCRPWPGFMIVRNFSGKADSTCYSRNPL